MSTGLPADAKARAPQKAAKTAVVPDRYKKATTTPLKRQVRPRKQTIDFALP
jgi:hypothetical protein